MLKAILEIERRRNPRLDFQTALKINLIDNDNILASGETNNISAGGIQFSISPDFDMIKEGDSVQFVFATTDGKNISAQGKIKYCQSGMNGKAMPVRIYGAKFVDVNIETWKYLVDFCSPNSAAFYDQVYPSPQNTQPGFKDENRKDYRVHTNIEGTIQLNGGAASRCRILDASYGGLKLGFDENIPPQTKAVVTFKFQKITYSLSGNLIWTLASPDEKTFVGGISLAELSPDQFEGLRRLVMHLAGIESV